MVYEVITLPAASLGTGGPDDRRSVPRGRDWPSAEGSCPSCSAVSTPAPSAPSPPSAGRGKGTGIVQFDAHADLRRLRYHGSRYNHACVMRRLHEDRGLPLFFPSASRAFKRQEAAYIRETSRRPFSRGAASPSGGDSSRPAPEEGFPERVYLTVDMDFFDPFRRSRRRDARAGRGWSGTPLSIILDVMPLDPKRTVVGFDVVELCPPREERVSVRAAVSFSTSWTAAYLRRESGIP